MCRNLFLLLALALACTSTAQPTWRFPICFEDGTGARDTIWLVYDTTATTGWNTPQVDYSLGEGRVDMDHTKFNVWVWNWDNDSTKTVAFPYTEFPYHNATVYAFNYQYPMTIRWDLSLGALPWLPQENWPIDGGMLYNGYFYMFNNCGGPPCGYFDITNEDSVTVYDPYPIEALPVDFTLGHNHGSGLGGQEEPRKVGIVPNPTSGTIAVTGIMGSCVAHVFSSMGNLLRQATLTAYDNTIHLDDLPSGTYFLTLVTPGHHEHFKLIKTE